MRLVEVNMNEWGSYQNRCTRRGLASFVGGECDLLPSPMGDGDGW